jgi:2-polyprenyl-6-methoxyphenol hydroxylase-like FAD-dependent oxidoreductase
MKSWTRSGQMPDMDIIIIGAGIGGLTTALSLHAAGIPTTIYESAREIRELGVGINLLPHAVRELTELNLLDSLRAEAVETSELNYFNKFGQLIWNEPRGLAAGYRWPQFSIHRGRLQAILLQAVQERLGEDRIVTGHHLAGFEELADGRIEATFVDRQSGEVLKNRIADATIAADGIHSKARSILYPHEGMPIWNGAVLWRGITDSAPFLTGRSMFMAGHENQKFVCYPISNKHFQAGRSLTNWIAELKFPPGPLPEREDWSREGDFADFLPQFESWQFDWLDIPSIIRAGQHAFEFPMVDRDPVESWAFGSIVLLGDAAHPMYPIGSNGASQGILDARVLARELSRSKDPVSAFRSYDTERRPPVSKIVIANRGNGPEQVMQMAEELAPEGFDHIDNVIPHEKLAEIANRYKQVAGFQKDALNERQSLSVGV